MRNKGKELIEKYYQRMENDINSAMIRAEEGIIDYFIFDVIRYYKCEMTSFKINFERQPRRIAKYAIDFYRVIKLAIENPNSIII